jgi:hypothetical protein
MLEHYKQPLLSRKAFALRLARCVTISAGLIAATILIGTLAFHYLEGFPWLDASLNSVMIMTGLGLTGAVSTDGGKLFTAIYAIFSTIVFFTILVILITPVLHRVLHRFHLEVESRDRV